MEGHPNLNKQVAAEAADWFVRLQEAPQPPALRAEFSKWLLRSPMHVDEFLAVTRLWGDLDQASGDMFSTESLVAAALAEPEATNVVPLERLGAVEREGGVASSGVSGVLAARNRFFLQAAASVAAVVILAFAYFGMHELLDAGHIQTDIGEQRTLALADGSIVHLNTNSDLTVNLEPHERHIRLLRGEARFEVAKDKSRPFFVETSGATVRAVGTIFNVRTEDAGTAVTVVEGRVELVARPEGHSGSAATSLATPPAQRTATASTQLGAGERAAVTTAGAIVPNVGPPLESVLAWSDQRLVFRDQPLADVIAEFNRYQKRPIRIADAQLAALSVNGTFMTNDSASLLQYLERYQDVLLEEASDGSRVLRLSRREEPATP